jgi:hypothetical protein
MRLWYAGRGVPWIPLLACLALAAAAAAVGHRWPHAMMVLLPAALAACAAAAGFTFDEAALPVVAVTPRGAGWRRTTRLAVAVLPLLWWVGIVGTVPDVAEPDRLPWLVVGLACIGFATGVAALGNRRETASPGSAVAPLVAGLVLTPVVIGPVGGWPPVLPLGPFPHDLITAWGAGAVASGLLATWAVRPGPPRRVRARRTPARRPARR